MLQPVFFSLITIYVPDDLHTTGLMSPHSSNPTTRETALTTLYREDRPCPREKFLAWATGPWASRATILDPCQSQSWPGLMGRLSEHGFLQDSEMRHWPTLFTVIPDCPRGCLSCLWNRDSVKLNLLSSSLQTFNPELAMLGGGALFLLGDVLFQTILRSWRKDEEVEMTVVALKRLVIQCSKCKTEVHPTTLTEHLLNTEH